MKNIIKKLTETGDRRSGFTIIEVLIVLAIAGLIMVIVFIAVPQLQRSARDNSRQNVITRVKSEIESYSSNNNGTYPFGSSGASCSGTTSGNWSDFYCRYVNNGTNAYVNDKDPSSGTSVFGASPAAYQPAPCGGAGVGAACTAARPSTGQAAVVYHAKCSGESLISSDGIASASTSTRVYAIIVGLDRSNTYFCIDNG